MAEKSTPERMIAARAARQHGLIATQQLHRLHFSDDQIHDRARAGRLHRIHRGVYAVGTPNLTREGHYLAAVLATGGILSHTSAAALWRIRDAPLKPVHVTVPRSSGVRSRPGIIVHRPRAEMEATTHRGIPITTPSRTLEDLARTLTRRQLERALDEAHFLGLHHEPGAGTTRTKSQPEEHFLAWLRRHRLPIPLLNAKINGVEVDALYEEHKLIVEIDPWHTHERRFAADRKRDRRHAAAGYVTFRIEDDQLTAETAGELERSLASRAGVSSSIAAKNPPTVSMRCSIDSAR